MAPSGYGMPSIDNWANAGRNRDPRGGESPSRRSGLVIDVLGAAVAPAGRCCTFGGTEMSRAYSGIAVALDRPMRRRASRALFLASIVALLVSATAYAKFGSSFSHICDTTIYAECVANDQYLRV